MVSGTAELAALEQEHTEDRALRLAEALVARAGGDDGFRSDLAAWWEQADAARTGQGDVTNTVSGGTFNGPVIQSRDFSGGITFGSAPPPATPQPPS